MLVERPAGIRSDDVRLVFERSIDIVRSALVSYYRLTEEEARGAEEDLWAWFQRLARRGSAQQIPARLLRVSLLSAACQYGRSFQLWKLGGEQSGDDELNHLLTMEPDEVAGDLERRFEEDRS